MKRTCILLYGKVHSKQRNQKVKTRKMIYLGEVNRTVQRAKSDVETVKEQQKKALEKYFNPFMKNNFNGILSIILHLHTHTFLE